MDSLKLQCYIILNKKGQTRASKNYCREFIETEVSLHNSIMHSMPNIA